MEVFPGKGTQQAEDNLGHPRPLPIPEADLGEPLQIGPFCAVGEQSGAGPSPLPVFCPGHFYKCSASSSVLGHPSRTTSDGRAGEQAPFPCSLVQGSGAYFMERAEGHRSLMWACLEPFLGSTFTQKESVGCPEASWPWPHLCGRRYAEGRCVTRLIHRIFSKPQVCKKDGSGCPTK